MDPIEEISSKKEEEMIIEEDNDNKENFKQILQQQLKSHLNEPTKIYLNKTNTQLEVRI
jgi:phosphoribosylaminoimidazole (AIR) synthetase